MLACGSEQHSQHTQPASGEMSPDSGKAPADGAAALLHGAHTQPEDLSPPRGQQQAKLLCASSAGDGELRPPGLRESAWGEQLLQLPEHSQSSTGAAGCSPAEPSPSAWARRPQSDATPPHGQHAPSGGAPSTALQRGSFSDGVSQAADPEHIAGNVQVQRDTIHTQKCYSSPATSAGEEADTALDVCKWRSNALGQAPGDGTAFNSKVNSQRTLARGEAQTNKDLSSTGQDCDGPTQAKASEDRAAEGQSMSPEEDELSRRMRSFLARLSEKPAAGRGSDSGAPGSAFSVQAAHGSEGASDRGEDVKSEQVICAPRPSCCLTCMY